MRTITLRLRIPDGRPGDTIEVDDERAAALVNAKYATYALDAEPVAEPDSSSDPVVELPAVSDVKAEWERVAENIGISLTDDDGNAKNKDVLVAEVTAAIG